MNDLAALSVLLGFDEAPAPASPTDGPHRVILPLDACRPGPELVAAITQPRLVRTAMSALASVLAQDQRRRARSRADYLAYLARSGTRVTADVWNAQRAYLASQFEAAQTERGPLPPWVTVEDGGVTFEVFSTDESAYARLALHPAVLDLRTHREGTSHVDLGAAPVGAMLRALRSHRPAELVLAPSSTATPQPRLVPHRWLRAFGLMQTAVTAPTTSFSLDPIDLYNVLFTLRRRRAKVAPRALRYELTPGAPARIVLEPWDHVIDAQGPPCDLDVPRVVRTWGRDRLLALGPLLADARSIRVHVGGPGQPSHYVLDLGHATFTLTLSAWTDRGWAGLSSADTLATSEPDPACVSRWLDTLTERRACTAADLAEATGSPPADVYRFLNEALLCGDLQATLGTDGGAPLYRRRPLLAVDVPREILRFRDPHDAHAHRLLATPGAVRLTRLHDLGPDGLRIEGEVEDAVAHRTYRTTLTLDREGRTTAATCTSAQFRRSGLKEGPTVPMIALRLAYARQQAALEEARRTPEGRARIHAETRVLTRRDRAGLTTFRISLDAREVIVRWGQRPDAMRLQRLFFTTPQQAQDEYFGRLDHLVHDGFVDGSDRID